MTPVPEVGRSLPTSPTLAANERIRARRAAGHPVVHLAFGEAGLPVLPALAEVLIQAAACNEYPPVAGTAAARLAAAGYWERRSLPTDPDLVLLAPGSKALLFGLLFLLPGDVVLPRPSWVSYAAQAQLAGKAAIGIPIPADAGGIPDPAQLERAVVDARRAGRNPGSLILTLPDNPTGTVASARLLAEVCAVAESLGLTVVSDEIYRDLIYGGEAFRSPAELLPETTIITTGLSKSVALGGWRIGAARLPDSPLGWRLRDGLVGVASEIWAGLPGPMQPVAAYAFSEPDEIRRHVDACRALHGAVSRALHAELRSCGVDCRPPQGGFYLYPDLEPFRPQVGRRGIELGVELAEWLLERHGVAVLAGAAFGDEPEALRFRAATSLLYGATEEQRWEAYRSPSPATLPWIAEAIAQVGAAIRDVIGG